MNEEPLLKVYAVQNRDGQYFRAKGYGGCGDTWVDSLTKARIYPKSGPARAQVTFFANNYPKYGIPTLVELHVTKTVICQEAERVKKSQDRKAKYEAEQERRDATWKLQVAQRTLSEAQATITKLMGAK